MKFGKGQFKGPGFLASLRGIWIKYTPTPTEPKNVVRNGYQVTRSGNIVVRP